MIFQMINVLCCIYVTLELLRQRISKNSKSPPDLSGRLPLIGHAWKLLGDRKHAFNFIKSMSQECLEKGGVLTLNLGPRMLYVVSDPDDCAKVCNLCLDKDFYYKFAKPFLGNGLTTADVAIWKQHRKAISPAFRQNQLNEFLVVFNHQAKRLVDQLKPEIGKGPFNHEKYIQLNSLESICMTAFGSDVADFGGLHKQYLQAISELLDIFTERFQKVWLYSDFIYKWSKLKMREDVLIKKINDFTSSVFKKRKAEIEEKKTVLDKSGLFTPFMNSVLELSKEPNSSYAEEDVLHETNSFIGGGFDTSSCIISLTLMNLGSYPEIQKRVYDELQDVFENSDRNVEKDDIPKLIYLEAVIKETLRLYPIAPMVARSIVKDIQLKNYTLKAGNGVGMLFWAMHRNKDWGPDVEQFRPERWMDGSLPSNPNAFAAFSIGKRACIGKTYAMMSMKTVLSHILRSYCITSDISGLELEIGTMLRPASGQNISIEERKSTFG